MLVLFDNGTPRTLARYLIDHHAVTEARARGWDELENGELLTVAEAAGFEVLVTTDKNISYQQSLTGRKIAVVVLGQGRCADRRRRERCGPGQLYRSRNFPRITRQATRFASLFREVTSLSAGAACAVTICYEFRESRKLFSRLKPIEDLLCSKLLSPHKCCSAALCV
jgi:predicted nuclease of predicted toxin-antitoxin system